MTTIRRGLGNSWWWASAGTGGAAAEGRQPGLTFGGMPENERRHRQLGGYQLQEVADAQQQQQQLQQEFDSDMFRMSYPRPRLRWTAELHDQFVKAVDELGGANKATPKAIMSLMGVQGITLYHLKSHLQKFRLGKTGRRMWKKQLAAADYCRRREELEALNTEAQQSSISNAFDMNRAAAMVSHSAMESQPAVKLEEFGAANKPALLPLFPPVPSCGMSQSYSPEWSELVEDGGGRRAAAGAVVAAAPRPVEEDYYYLSSLGYSATEFASREASRDCVSFGSFFDEVASFSKVDEADVAADGSVFGHGSS